MRIDAQYQPWVLAAKDESRHVLTMVLADKSERYGDCLVAANGFALSAVPCMFDDTDVLGQISAVSLQAAIKQARKDQGTRDYLFVGLTADMLTVGSYSYPRGDQSGQFPDYPRLLEDVTSADAQFGHAIAYNPELLLDVRSAFCGGLKVSERTSGVVLHAPVKCQGATLVTMHQNGRPCSTTADIKTPFALVMPMSIPS